MLGSACHPLALVDMWPDLQTDLTYEDGSAKKTAGCHEEAGRKTIGTWRATMPE
jgi:hypothetical protein